MIKYTDSYWQDIDKTVCAIPGLAKLQKKTVLLTGATGLIGSSVADLLFHLKRTYHMEIQVLLAGRSSERIHRRFYPFKEDKDYSFLPFDATRYGDSMEDIKLDYVIDSASNANPALFDKEPVQTMLCNIVGVDSLLHNMAQSQTKRFLYISSSEVYGQKSSPEPYKEDEYGFVDILNPRACYPVSKRAAETLCTAYAKEYGIDFVVVRPGHIYGPAITDTDARASAQFTRDVFAGKNILMKTPGQQLRSYCFSMDCASAILCVLLNGRTGEAYNISNKDSIVSIRKLAEMLAHKGNCNIEFAQASDAEQRSYNLMDNSSLNAEKLERLGWQGMFDLENGVQKTLEHMMNQTETNV